MSLKTTVWSFALREYAVWYPVNMAMRYLVPSLFVFPFTDYPAPVSYPQFALKWARLTPETSEDFLNIRPKDFDPHGSTRKRNNSTSRRSSKDQKNSSNNSLRRRGTSRDCNRPPLSTRHRRLGGICDRNQRRAM